MQRPKQVKGNLIRQERVDRRDNRNPDRPSDEDQSLAIDIPYATPYEEKAAKGERVRRHNPLQTTLGDREGVSNSRENNDDALDRDGLRKTS